MKYLQSKSVFEHLKSFNESVINIDEVIQTVEDILLPISDMGYDIVIHEHDDNCIIIRVVRYSDPILKIDNEVRDEFKRMNDYLESSGFNSIEANYVRFDNIEDPSEFNGKLEFSDFIVWLEGRELLNLLFVAKRT